jgi:two-component system chemotaxis response regulator CheY
MDFLDDVVSEFLDETQEQLGFILDDILILEKENDAERINRIFRVFHTIKGNSRMLGFEILGHFTHLAEELLSRIRKGERDIDREAIDLILASVDQIRAFLCLIRTAGHDQVDTNVLCARIEAALNGNFQPFVPSGYMKEPEIPLHLAGTKNPIELIPSDEAIPFVLGPSFLVVEDDFTSRQILCHFLARYGTCHVAKDGVEAVEAVRLAHEAKQPYRLICMDIQMPRMDGTEATREIRRLEGELGLADSDEEVKIVITSALSDAGMIVKACYECGADYYFTKPLDLEKISRQLMKMGFK